MNFWSRQHSSHAYPTLESFLADVTEIVSQDLCATYIQIDAPQYALLIDPAIRGFYEQQAAQTGRSVGMQQWLDRALELDNAVISAASAATFGVHLCRGNQASRWLAEGGCEPIADGVPKDQSSQALAGVR